LLFLAAAATRLYFVRRPRPVYLVEYACFCAAPAYRAPSATFLEHTRLMMHGAFDEDGAAAVVSFTEGTLERSGFGEETCVPPWPQLHPARQEPSRGARGGRARHLLGRGRRVRQGSITPSGRAGPVRRRRRGDRLLQRVRTGSGALGHDRQQVRHAQRRAERQSVRDGVRRGAGRGGPRGEPPARGC